MLSDKHNLLMAKSIGLKFSMLTLLAQEVPFGIPQYIQFILHGPLSSAKLLILANSKYVDFAVPYDGLYFSTEIVPIFHSGNYDCRDFFASYCYVMG